ncbi:MAG: hypothetical protein N2248_08190 [candidate division WOR-3 bacterium]|nr:hypothetical protein [candidate division WOR-3 bacterium]
MKKTELCSLFHQWRNRLEHQLDRYDEKGLLDRVRQQLQTRPLRRLLIRLRRFRENPARVRLGSRLDLLLLLLYAPGRTGRTAEPLLGMTRITKLLFLALKELKLDRLVPRHYRFVPYKLGPFAPEIYSDLELLITAGLVRAVSLEPDGTPVLSTDAQTIRQLLELNSGVATAERLDAASLMFELTPQGRALARHLYELASRRLHQLDPGLKILKARFGALPLATLLRYVYTRYPEYTTRSEIVEKLLGPARTGTKRT